MMVMTAKVDMKKVLLGLAAVAALILCLVLLFGGGEKAAQTGAPAVGNNDQRVKFLTDLGWQVTTSPKESSQVKIPASSGEVFDRYNTLQKGQGYDLTQFAGKKVMRYVYQVNNYPGAASPVYATLLVYKNQVIGGDITNTAAGGKLQGLKPGPAPMPTSPSQPSVPSAPSGSTESAESAAVPEATF